MKVAIEFDLYEDKQALEDFISTQNSGDTDEAVWDRVFRPNFKHGYGKEIDDLIEKCGKTVDADGDEQWHGANLIEKLSEIYLEIKDVNTKKPRFNLSQVSYVIMLVIMVALTSFGAGYCCKALLF